MEGGTPEFRSRGEEKGAKKAFQRENTYVAKKEKGIRGVSGDQRFGRLVRLRSFRSFGDSYRIGVEVSGVAVDGELVVLRDDGVGDLSVGPRSVLGVPVDGAHLSHARSCKKKKRRGG